MRLGIFVPTPYRHFDNVQSAIWIRALQMIEPLRNCGWEVSLNNPFKRYDVTIYHRGMLRKSLHFVRFLRHIARKVYWDTCVDYFDEHEAAGPVHVDCARRIAGIADGVIVPTDGIAESAKRFNSQIFVMPDPVDLQHFSTVKSDVNLASPRIGWSGVASKAKFLAPYADFLDGRMLIISDAPPQLPFKYDFLPWRHCRFPADLGLCDVAFLPRTLDSTYTANNSSFKALVFAVLGIPIIATALPAYREMAKSYAAISFLEDCGDSPERALGALTGTDRDASAVRQAFDRYLWAANLTEWLHGQ